jgi:hypothetical protein
MRRSRMPKMVVVGAWFCGVRRCFEHARFQFFYVLFAEEHVNADGVVGPWNQHDAVVFCSYGASSAKAEKVGFELNVGDGPVVLGVVTLGWDARGSSGVTYGAVCRRGICIAKY